MLARLSVANWSNKSTKIRKTEREREQCAGVLASK